MSVSTTFALDERRKFEALLKLAAKEDGFGTPPLDLRALGDWTGASRYLLCIRDLRGRFVRLSHSWEANLGYALEDLEGVPLLDLVHPADVWLTHDRMDAVRAQRAAGLFINRYRCSDGGFRRLEWTAQLFGDQVFGIACDITDPNDPG
jgi:PAS domain S-box-containing protein